MAKRNPPDYQAIHAIADRRAPAMRRAFIDAVASVRGGDLRRQLERLLREGRDEEALRRAEAMWKAIAEADLRLRIAEQTLQILQEVGARETDRLVKTGKTLRVAGGVTVPTRFDIVNSRAVTWASERAGTLIRGITDEQRQVIRTVLARAQAGQMTSRQVAAEIQQSIGLRPDQEAAAAAFRTELEQLAALGRSQTRGLRVGRVSNRGLTQAKIDEKVDRYRRKLLRQRAELIASHESHEAAGEGLLESWRQGRERGAIPPTMEKTLIITDDDRLCPICKDLDGQSVPIEQPFLTPVGPKMRTPIHARCRCSMGLVEKRRQRRVA